MFRATTGAQVSELFSRWRFFQKNLIMWNDYFTVFWVEMLFDAIEVGCETWSSKNMFRIYDVHLICDMFSLLVGNGHAVLYLKHPYVCKQSIDET